LDAPSAEVGPDEGGTEWDGAESVDPSAAGAIPSNVLRRFTAVAIGPGAGVDDTRTAGGRNAAFGRLDAGFGGAIDASFGGSDMGRFSDCGLGSSDGGFARSEEFGLSLPAQASSISSVAGVTDDGAGGDPGATSDDCGRHEGSRGSLLSAGSLIVFGTWCSARGALG
jgi:hypothetical protein